MNIFYERLKELRSEKGLTQEQLAHELNISRYKITKWESGLTKPNINNLIQLAIFFDVSIAYLIGMED